MDQAASELEISRRTITRWVSEKKLRVYKVEGDRRRWVDLDEIAKLREPKPIEPPEKQ